jgi:putative endopeptidase
MNKPAVFASVAVCLLVVACTRNSTESESQGIVVANMDRTVKPGDDFFHYANGGWIKQAQLPQDTGYVAVDGYLRNDLSNELSRKRSADLIQEAIRANAPAGSNLRKIADLYLSYMNEAEIESRGLAPLRPHLERISAIRDRHDLARALGESLRADVEPLNWNFFPVETAGTTHSDDRRNLRRRFRNAQDMMIWWCSILSERFTEYRTARERNTAPFFGLFRG